jgi:hypothetical protein
MVLDVEGQLAAPVPAGVDAAEADQPGHDEQAGAQPDRVLGDEDGVVHDPRHDQRDDGLDEGGHQ